MAEERESETTLVAGIESSPLMMEVLLVATCCGRGSSRAGKKECKQGEGAREVVACRPLGSRALRSRCGAGDSPRFFLLQPREIACVVVKIHLRARFSTVGSTCDLISAKLKLQHLGTPKPCSPRHCCSLSSSLEISMHPRNFLHPCFWILDPSDSRLCGGGATILLPGRQCPTTAVGKMASGRGKSKDVMVTDEQLAQVEYELARNRMVEENEERMARLGIPRASVAFKDACEASRPPKQKKRKAPSSTLENTTERRVLRSRVANESANANPTDQPSKEITTKLVDGEKGGRTITKKANIYARMNKPKIKIPFNEYGQPIGPDATEFANFIGTLVRKHIPPKAIDWRDVDEEKKLLVWDHLQAFYELDSIALKYVINTSQRKWKEWKADLKKTKFDPELTDEELMPRCDDRISEADWKDLLKYWRSPEFEARSSTAKENRAKSTVPHTAGSKSHARVTQEMADELGYAPRRDEVFIRTHTLKKGPNKGQHVPEAAPIISELLRAANVHPDWKEKSLKEGDLFARVVGMKEPRGRVRVLGLGPTPQDVGTPDTRGKVSTRVLVEMVARREAEHRMSTLEEKMQQMQQQMNKMQEIMAASQGGHNLEAPSSQHGSNSRRNSIDEIEEEIDGEDGDEEDGEDDNVQRRKFVANPRNASTQQDESLIGMDVLLYAWTGPETPVAKATVLSVDPDTTVGGEPLGPGTYEVIVNVAIKRDTILPYQYEDLLYIRDAVTRSIAWPSSKMKPYKPAVSGSSRH